MESSTNCVACGAALESGAGFCSNCGAKQEPTSGNASVYDSIVPPAPDLSMPDLTPPSFDVPSAPYEAPSAAAPAAPAGQPSVPATPAGPLTPAAPANPAPGAGYTPPAYNAAPIPPQPGYTAPAAPGYSAPQQPGGYPAQQPAGGYTTSGYGQPAPGYSAPAPGGYSAPAPGYGAPVQPTYTSQPVPPAPTKKNPAAVVIVAIILIAVIVLGVFAVTRFGSATGSYNMETYTSPFVWNGLVEYGYTLDGEPMFSFTATNESDKTIVYFEFWAYYYDASGKPVYYYDGNTEDYMVWWGHSLYLRPGATADPAELGYWDMNSPSAEYMFIYINYLEFSDGTWEGISDEQDFAMSEVWSAMDYVADLADEWALKQAR